MKNIAVKFLFEVTVCIWEHEDILYSAVSIFFLNLDSVRSYIQDGKLHRRDIRKGRQFFWRSFEARNSEKASDLCRLQLPTQLD